jgi:dihydrofolate synthase/folylpolyglutamate synthase
MPPEPATLDAWLERIERLHPREIELGLARVAEVARRMGLSPGAPPSIVVGGTNGKGSCIAVMERLLRAQGCRVGTYTSPHLRRYNERVRLQGREVDDAPLCAAFAEVERARGEVPLTFFEFGTLAALAVFREEAPDWALLEVGLGGRLDAVNIVEPRIAVVTSIQLDHTDWLGPDRESIAREKAGIFRAGRPAVVAEREVPRSLREAAAACGALWYGIGADFDCGARPGGGWAWRGTGVNGAATGCELPSAPRLLGSNVAAALQALALIGRLPDAAVLAAELPRLGLEGRQQRCVCKGVDCVLDVAHNPDGVELLAARLRAEPVAGKTAVVFAAMQDKDAGGMLGALAGVGVACWWLPALPVARAAPPATLAACLVAACPGAQVKLAASVDAGLDEAASTLGAGDRLVVCGSFHLVGPALDWIEARQTVQGGTG